jgi:hypothetical protein
MSNNQILPYSGEHAMVVFPERIVFQTFSQFCNFNVKPRALGDVDVFPHLAVLLYEDAELCVCHDQPG